VIKYYKICRIKCGLDKHPHSVYRNVALKFKKGVEFFPKEFFPNGLSPNIFYSMDFSQK